MMNNIVYCKTIKNVRNRVDVILVTNAERYKKTSKYTIFFSQKIFNKTLIVAHKVVGAFMKVLTLNKLTNVHMCILDLRETLMYDIHYSYIKDSYDKKVILLLTNTDSLAHEFEPNNVCKDFFVNKDIFDFSEHSQTLCSAASSI